MNVRSREIAGVCCAVIGAWACVLEQNPAFSVHQTTSTSGLDGSEVTNTLSTSQGSTLGSGSSTSESPTSISSISSDSESSGASAAESSDVDDPWEMLLNDPLLVGWYTTEDPDSLVIADGDRVVDWLEQHGGEPFWMPNGRAPILTPEGHLRFDAAQRPELERSGGIGESDSATYVLRLRLDSVGAAYSEILGASTSEPTFPDWHRNIGQNSEGAFCSDDRTDAQAQRICSAPVGDGQWHVIAFTMEPSGARWWTDGWANAAFSPWLAPEVLQWTLGSTTHHDEHWTGDLAELVIWRRALDDDELGVVFANIVP